MNLSSGAKKDLMVLIFVKALIDYSLTDEQDPQLAQASGLDYHTNKRLNRGLKKLSDRIQATIGRMYSIGGKDLVKWHKSNLDKRIKTTLTDIQMRTINLEMLALRILFLNFCERDAPVHPVYLEYTLVGQYYRLLDVLETTNIADIDKELYLLSYDIVGSIKR